MLRNGHVFSAKPWVCGIELIQSGVVAMVTFKARVVSNSSDISLYLGWHLGSWKVFSQCSCCIIRCWLTLYAYVMRSLFMCLSFPQCQIAVVCYSVLVSLLVDSGPIIQAQQVLYPMDLAFWVRLSHLPALPPPGSQTLPVVFGDSSVSIFCFFLSGWWSPVALVQHPGLRTIFCPFPMVEVVLFNLCQATECLHLCPGAPGLLSFSKDLKALVHGRPWVEFGSWVEFYVFPLRQLPSSSHKSPWRKAFSYLVPLFQSFCEYPLKVYGENPESGCKLLFYLWFPVFNTLKLAHIESLAICQTFQLLVQCPESLPSVVCHR